MIAKTDTERKVCNIVEDVLQVSGVQISDDFFEIGGDSLRATEFVAKSRKKLFKSKKLGLRFSKIQRFQML